MDIDYLDKAKEALGIAGNPDAPLPDANALALVSMAQALAQIVQAETQRAILDELREQRKPALGRCATCEWFASGARECMNELMSTKPTQYQADMPNFGCVCWEPRE